MKNGKKEFWVEYEWEDTPYGKRPNLIRTFKTKAEAEDFKATTEDGKVVELTMMN